MARFLPVLPRHQSKSPAATSHPPLTRSGRFEKGTDTRKPPEGNFRVGSMTSTGKSGERYGDTRFQIRRNPYECDLCLTRQPRMNLERRAKKKAPVGTRGLFSNAEAGDGIQPGNSPAFRTTTGEVWALRGKWWVHCSYVRDGELLRVARHRSVDFFTGFSPSPDAHAVAHEGGSSDRQVNRARCGCGLHAPRPK